MNLLEFSQILANLTLSVAALLFIVLISVVGMSIVRITRKVENGIETIKKDSAVVREKVSHFFTEISLVSLAAKLNGWFNKKRSSKNK
jgi:hypothetical protein